MAAPKKTTVNSDSDSDSSDNRERFREAAWNPPGVTALNKQAEISPAVSSSRVRPDCHEHDGNELQTTPEFRSHVAKKLAAMLDSCIKETPGHETLLTKPDSADEDDGFRLFVTSVPGNCGTVTSSVCTRRKVASSCSEDSEEEKLRFQEAAVSAADILKHSAIIPEQKDKCETQAIQKKRKKKKKKQKREAEEGDEEGLSEVLTSESGKNGLSEKKKKRKKHKVDLEPCDRSEEDE
ncbi:protein CUSTOS isoform X2 [Bombina bombina]|uniref:protein CUSTOS isoform X2 n=1 Tax=Bombina bombina TaxID=8345 RepID=UPI00235A9F6B|nr:protein CUSTOS isoform X2 [Bombina bombina]